MLTEQEYKLDVLDKIAYPRALYAVNIMVRVQRRPKEYRKPMQEIRMRTNLNLLELAAVPYYGTFTNVPPEERDAFWGWYCEIYRTSKSRCFCH